jgi:hypothetical protein
MLRKSIICILPLLLLAGCDKPDNQGKEVYMNMPAPNAAPMMAPFVPPPDIIIGGRGANALFSLRHDLKLTMPHDAVAARYQNARDACLQDKTLNCTLTSASLNVSRIVSGQLQVALPHDKVALFEKRLLKPLPQDRNGKVEVTSRSTTVENETEAAADIDRQLVQATAYRDSLELLAKRPNLTVDEIIKIHSELTEAQTAVENAMAAKRASDSHIRLERMDISLGEKVELPQTSAFDGFWKNAGNTLVASTAEMLLRIVNVLPWLPVALLLAWLVARFVRRLQVRRKSLFRSSE